MPTGITTVVGHAPIPGSFAGFAGAGRAFGRLAFAGSSDLIARANDALARYQSDIDQIHARCESHSSGPQSWFDSWAGADPASTICQNARDLQANHDAASAVVNNPYATDQQIVRTMRLIPYASDIAGLETAIEATSAGSSLSSGWEETLGLPGEGVGFAADTAGAIGLGILKNIPWWIYAIGGAVLAVQLGIIGPRRA